MQRVLEKLPPNSRAAILRFRSLGDCVLTTPAIDILKQARPDLRVAVLVEDRFRAIFEGNPDIDEILPPSLRALRKFQPILTINFHGGTHRAWMTALSGARYRAGFSHFRLRFVHNLRIPRAQEILGEDRTVHTAEHMASAMFWLGAKRVGIPRAKLFNVGQVGNQPQVTNLPHGPYAVFHPIAATPAKTWRPNGFLEVARHLSESGLNPVFIGSAHEDLSPFAAFPVVQGASLAEIKALLETASLFLGNDSGPAHMAAAFGLPVVVIFGESNPRIWGPWRTVSEVVTSPSGIQNVGAAQVIAAAARMRVHA